MSHSVIKDGNKNKKITANYLSFCFCFPNEKQNSYKTSIIHIMRRRKLKRNKIVFKKHATGASN